MRFRPALGMPKSRARAERQAGDEAVELVQHAAVREDEDALALVRIRNLRNDGDAAGGKIPQALAGAERVLGIARLEARVVLRVAGLHLGVGQALEDSVVPFAQVPVGANLQRKRVRRRLRGLPRARQVARIDRVEVLPRQDFRRPPAPAPARSRSAARRAAPARGVPRSTRSRRGARCTGASSFLPRSHPGDGADDDEGAGDLQRRHRLAEDQPRRAPAPRSARN